MLHCSFGPRPCNRAAGLVSEVLQRTSCLSVPEKRSNLASKSVPDSVLGFHPRAISSEKRDLSAQTGEFASRSSRRRWSTIRSPCRFPGKLRPFVHFLVVATRKGQARKVSVHLKIRYWIAYVRAQFALSPLGSQMAQYGAVAVSIVTITGRPAPSSTADSDDHGQQRE
jgi:hypothetical protein